MDKTYIKAEHNIIEYLKAVKKSFLVATDIWKRSTDEYIVGTVIYFIYNLKSKSLTLDLKVVDNDRGKTLFCSFT